MQLSERFVTLWNRLAASLRVGRSAFLTQWHQFPLEALTKGHVTPDSPIRIIAIDPSGKRHESPYANANHAKAIWGKLQGAHQAERISRAEYWHGSTLMQVIGS